MPRMKIWASRADHRQPGPGFPQGTRNHLGNQQACDRRVSHVCRPCPERISSVEGAGQETARVVFARSVPASTSARCAVRALHRSICSCAGRRVRFPGAGWSLRPSRDTANKGGVAYPFEQPDAAGVTRLCPEARLVPFAVASSRSGRPMAFGSRRETGTGTCWWNAFAASSRSRCSCAGLDASRTQGYPPRYWMTLVGRMMMVESSCPVAS